MTTSKIRVGIIGANVHYGWGSSAHIPALKALPDFELTAVCTSRQETAEETAHQFDIPLAFHDPLSLVQHPNVDLVSICVRVPFHYQLGMAALEAGKHLFCEWPLAATTEQARQMHNLAQRKGVCHVVGLQARGAPVLNRARDLVADGYIGQPLSCTMIVATLNWGTEFTNSRAYLADRSTGATLMTIPGGHSIDALCFCLGEFKELSSLVATQRPQVKNIDTGEILKMTSPDQVLLNGVLENGTLASVHVKGGTANGIGFLFEIQGTDGDLIIGPMRPRPGSSVQISDLSLKGSREATPLEEVQIPENYRWVPSEVPAGPPFNVGQLFVRMAEAIRHRKPAAPDFDLAVKRHHLLDVIQKASDTGRRQAV
jgi:predicted dehydrogenase